MELKNCTLGIEFGSTRIKGVLVDENHQVLATGGYTWASKLKDGVWTYEMDEVHRGLQACFADIKAAFESDYHQPLTEVGAIGISGMMHGFLPFDKDMKLLTPFRTWQNTITQDVAETLSAAFQFNVPQRWSIAHLYQDVLNGAPYVKDIAYFTTLAGYIHWMLTGEKVLGVGEASGMFPIDSDCCDYSAPLLTKFDEMCKEKDIDLSAKALLPKVLCAGESAGVLTPSGAKLLDITGTLHAGIPFAPPEGDAGTGMVATNSVRTYTGNVSAGTSIFLMVVMDHLPKMHTEIDMVTTPSGKPVAMVHCNNCTADINGWVGLFQDFADSIGGKMDLGHLYDLLFKKALEADSDCGGLVSYNYLSGEVITGLNAGMPLFIRKPDSRFTLANFMKTQLFASLATLKLGLDILNEEEVRLDMLYGHGGLFKTPGVGQRYMAAACNSPVTCMETAGEGGPYGMALLAAYLLNKDKADSLEDYLDNLVFSGAKTVTLEPDPAEIESFMTYMKNYKKLLPVEKTAVDC